jgi:hypothetical protein
MNKDIMNAFGQDSPEQIGFVIGGIVGLVWVFWAMRDVRGRAVGSFNYIWMLICGGIGAGIGWLVSRLFLLLG